MMGVTVGKQLVSLQKVQQSGGQQWNVNNICHIPPAEEMMWFKVREGRWCPMIDSPLPIHIRVYVRSENSHS